MEGSRTIIKASVFDRKERTDSIEFRYKREYYIFLSSRNVLFLREKGIMSLNDHGFLFWTKNAELFVQHSGREGRPSWRFQKTPRISTFRGPSARIYIPPDQCFYTRYSGKKIYFIVKCGDCEIITETVMPIKAGRSKTVIPRSRKTPPVHNRHPGGMYPIAPPAEPPVDPRLQPSTIPRSQIPVDPRLQPSSSTANVTPTIPYSHSNHVLINFIQSTYKLNSNLVCFNLKNEGICGKVARTWPRLCDECAGSLLNYNGLEEGEIIWTSS